MAKTMRSGVSHITNGKELGVKRLPRRRQRGEYQVRCHWTSPSPCLKSPALRGEESLLSWTCGEFGPKYRLLLPRACEPTQPLGRHRASLASGDRVQPGCTCFIPVGDGARSAQYEMMGSFQLSSIARHFGLGGQGYEGSPLAVGCASTSRDVPIR